MVADEAYVDTNVFLRMLLNDHARLSPTARRIFEAAGAGRLKLVTAPATLSEVVFVLTAPALGRSRLETVAALRAILALPVRVTERSIVEAALQLYESIHDDWDDCLVAAYAIASTAGRVASFDTRLGRVPGLTRIVDGPQQ